MESIAVALIGGVVTLVGVIVSNSRSRAVMELKIDELTRRVEKYNCLNQRRLRQRRGAQTTAGVQLRRRAASREPDALVRRFREELAWGLVIAACIPVLLAAAVLMPIAWLLGLIYSK